MGRGDGFRDVAVFGEEDVSRWEEGDGQDIVKDIVEERGERNLKREEGKENGGKMAVRAGLTKLRVASVGQREGILRNSKKAERRLRLNGDPQIEQECCLALKEATRARSRRNARPSASAGLTVGESKVLRDEDA